ncbi:tyrosine-type recombinase/integrase [Arundinibacter roseus]|uniref:Tyrosine recombinase XerC n=1 Tax=Arundinibacter roseus TaxID=2070510 RepID=A0A4R4KDE5_9BACT|nr:tyrosine-type recombinase/integrase [Arundinibacter roseus]TDB65858.1 integrase [Arundinibacter roseus]
MITLFLDHLRHEKRLSEHTLTAYSSDLQQLTTYLLLQYECAEPHTASSQQLRSWVVSMVEENIKPTSLNRKMATLRSFYGFLRRRNLIPSDPTKTLHALKEKKKLPAYVEEKAMEVLFEEGVFSDDFSGLRDRIILELLYGTGMRLTELITLRIKDIDLEQRLIRVTGKGSKERLIPITGLLVQALTEYLAQRGALESSDILILTDKFKPAYAVFVQRTVKNYLSAVTTLAQKSPHVLRHTYATHLLNRGADLNAIKELLGHANFAATQIYTHNSIEKLKKTHQQAHPKA